MKITGRQLLLVVSIGAAQHPPVYWGTDLLALIKIQLILKKTEKLFCLGAGFPFVLPFSFLHRLIRNRKHHCADDCWVSSQRSRSGAMRHNLGFTIWRYRKRSPNCCCACYYQKCFQCLCKSLPCQVGVVEVALGVPRSPSPGLVCRVQRSSLGMGLVFGSVEQDQAALEDTVSKTL